MKHTLFLVVLLAFAFFVFCMAFAGCSTENPLCTDNYCVEGKIFERSELEEGQAFDALPANINEDSIKRLWTLEVDTDFQPITVTGKADWDFTSTNWQYREDGISYLKKLTLEFEGDEGRFGENRIILIHLNKDTVIRDQHFVEHVDFLGTISVRLTHHIGIATFKGDVVGAPTKP